MKNITSSLLLTLSLSSAVVAMDVDTTAVSGGAASGGAGTGVAVNTAELPAASGGAESVAINTKEATEYLIARVFPKRDLDEKVIIRHILNTVPDTEKPELADFLLTRLDIVDMIIIPFGKMLSGFSSKQKTIVYRFATDVLVTPERKDAGSKVISSANINPFAAVADPVERFSLFSFCAERSISDINLIECLDAVGKNRGTFWPLYTGTMSKMPTPYCKRWLETEIYNSRFNYDAVKALLNCIASADFSAWKDRPLEHKKALDELKRKALLSDFLAS